MIVNRISLNGGIVLTGIVSRTDFMFEEVMGEDLSYLLQPTRPQGLETDGSLLPKSSQFEDATNTCELAQASYLVFVILPPYPLLLPCSLPVFDSYCHPYQVSLIPAFSLVFSVFLRSEFMERWTSHVLIVDCWWLMVVWLLCSAVFLGTLLAKIECTSKSLALRERERERLLAIIVRRFFCIGANAPIVSGQICPCSCQI
jgi:hypothetical protein